MKKLLLIVTILLIISANSAFAGALPPGSYTQSCADAVLKGGTLSAVCKRFDGSSNNTQLPFANSCEGIISNINGILACSGPTGSYALTCKKSQVKNHRLYATCERNDGSWNDSNTSFSGFQHPVTNCNGNLVDRPNC